MNAGIPIDEVYSIYRVKIARALISEHILSSMQIFFYFFDVCVEDIPTVPNRVFIRKSNMQNKLENKPRYIRNFTIANIIIITLFITAYVYLINGKEQGFVKISLGKNTSFEINMKGNTIEHSDLFKKLLSGKNREDTLFLLKKYKVYHIADTDLVNQLERIDKKSQISALLRRLLQDLRGPFSRTLHSFYDINNRPVIKALEKLGYNHIVSHGIRNLYKYRRGPFESLFKPVDLSTPNINIRVGFAAACRNNEFYGQTIKLIDKSFDEKSITVVVNKPIGSPACNIRSKKNTLSKLIQLSREDMKQLKGNLSRRKIEPGFAQEVLE